MQTVSNTSVIKPILFNSNVKFHCLGRRFHTAEIPSHKMGQLTVKSCTLLTKRPNCDLYLNAIKPCNFYHHFIETCCPSPQGRFFWQITKCLHDSTVSKSRGWQLIHKFYFQILHQTTVLHWYVKMMTIIIEHSQNHHPTQA